MLFNVSGYFWYEIFIIILSWSGNSYIFFKILSTTALTLSHSIITSAMILVAAGWSIRYNFKP